jgi:hypothetical protein
VRVVKATVLQTATNILRVKEKQPKIVIYSANDFIVASTN